LKPIVSGSALDESDAQAPDDVLWQLAGAARLEQSRQLARAMPSPETL
jgi:hypothetical protein